MTLRSRMFQKKNRTTTLIVGVILFVAIGLALDAFLASRRFRNQYQAYSAAETEYETAAYKPAVGSNPIRQEVSYILVQVLQVPMSDATRLGFAKQGIAHLNDMEGEIDAIKVESDNVGPLIDTLEITAGNIGNIRNRAKMRELVALARKNVSTISDIRGLSYRTDFYTDEVFERIIDDQGKMTPEHVTYLNDLIPQLEAQFNQRTNLYTRLGEDSKKLKQLAVELGYATP